MPRLFVVTDYADSPEDAPTRPGTFPTPGGLPDRDHVVHRLVCPHHHIPWIKVVALNIVIAATTLLVACVLR
jgi:hypothetical protein